MKIIYIIALAFVLDLIFGDPRWLPHPICLIGNAISYFEKKIRKMFISEFFGGVTLVFIILILSFFVPFLVLFFAKKINFYFGFLLETYFCYQIFATKSLKTESMKVYTPLIKNDLEKARKYLSYIVGRDTKNLDKKAIIKATVETISENTTDGIIAPLFFMVIGGAPLAFLYKAINTLDSMIGYKNEKYIKFGKFAARLDDIANFLPARIAAFFMIISSFFLRLNLKNAIKIYARDKKNHKSPNSAQTEAVCAGALEIQLAGDCYYFGQLVKKQTIGDDIRPIRPDDIILANRLMYVTSILSVFIFLLLRSFV